MNAPYKPPSPAAAKAAKVLIVDDHTIVREGIVALMRVESEFEVCADTGTFREALELAKKLAPDIVILDYFLEGNVDGADAIRTLTSLPDGPRVLVLSLHREEEFGERALRAGARGFLSKKEGASQLVSALRTVLSGGFYISSRLEALLFERLAGNALVTNTPGIDRLTERELQVYRLIGANLTVAQIASRLSLSVHTVATHRENLKHKLNLQSAEEVAYSAALWLKASASI
jgi:DNA-binding NarL/FixJ family response regulator